MFRYWVGGLLAIIGSVALLANSYLLGNGAVRWAHEHDTWERAALAAGGAAVPWLLAVIPMLFSIVVITSHALSRFGQRFLIVLLWVIFFFYNFMMGTSNIAKLREEKVAEIAHKSEALDNTRDQLKNLKAQLAGIPQHRPADTVERLIEAEKNNKRWTSSGECTDATARASRDFCMNLRTLEGERDSALKADKLTTQIDALSSKIEAAPPVTTASADPFVDGVSEVTGMAQRSVRVLLAMATPVVLEVMGASCWKLAIILFGWTLKREETGESEREIEARRSVQKPALIQSPAAIKKAPVVSIDMLTARRQLCEYFFREHTRHIESGVLPEEDFYRHYGEICRQSNDAPLPVETFRRIAAKFVSTMEDIDGKKFYRGILPYMQNSDAA